MEHLHHFGLGQDPFRNEPDLRFYFDSTSQNAAQLRVERGLRQQRGLTVLTAEGGMGKTLLARRILEGLEEEVFEATLLVMLPGSTDGMGLLQRFARQLGCEEPLDDRAGLLAQIYERLAMVREEGRHAVLIVDDAQIMGPEVFGEICGLLNLEYEDRRLLSMLFVGSPELDRMVQDDPAIRPRVDIRVCLEPFDLMNACAYLEHRIEAARGKAEVLPRHAMEIVYKFAGGRPRLMNTLADNALFEAYLAGRDAIDSGDVERAASDLGIEAAMPLVQAVELEPELDFSVAPVARQEPIAQSLDEGNVPALDLEEAFAAAPVTQSLSGTPDDSAPGLHSAALLEDDDGVTSQAELLESRDLALDQETLVQPHAAPFLAAEESAAPMLSLEPDRRGVLIGLDEANTSSPFGPPASSVGVETGGELLLDREPEMGGELLLDHEPEAGVELLLDHDPGSLGDLSLDLDRGTSQSAALVGEAPILELPTEDEDFVLSEDDLAPLDFDDENPLDDAFVELLEE